MKLTKEEKIKCPDCKRPIKYVGAICKCELSSDTEGCEDDSRD
jgi:hypothetical protein